MERPEQQNGAIRSPNRHLWIAVSVLGTALIVRWVDPAIYRISSGIAPGGVGGATFINLISTLWYALPATLVIVSLHGVARVGDELGLRRGGWHGTVYAFCFAVPMLVGYALMGKRADISLPVLIINQLRAAVREEMFYRAFLFGQLFRHGRWGFVPAVAVNAVVFAHGHLYQAQSLWDGMAVFAVTLIGAVWFAWLFVAWGYNLWVPMGMHFWMNLWWEVFQIGQSAFSGSVMVEVLRSLTVLVSAAWTLRWMRRHGRGFPPHALWWQREQRTVSLQKDC